MATQAKRPRMSTPTKKQSAYETLAELEFAAGLSKLKSVAFTANVVHCSRVREGPKAKYMRGYFDDGKTRLEFICFHEPHFAKLQRKRGVKISGAMAESGQDKGVTISLFRNSGVEPTARVTPVRWLSWRVVDLDDVPDDDRIFTLADVELAEVLPVGDFGEKKILHRYRLADASDPALTMPLQAWNEDLEPLMKQHGPVLTLVGLQAASFEGERYLKILPMTEFNKN